MKWLLVITLLPPMEDNVAERFTFDTKVECVTAAQAFVRGNPSVRLRDHVDSFEVEPPSCVSMWNACPGNTNQRKTPPEHTEIPPAVSPEAAWCVALKDAKKGASSPRGLGACA